jgi:hypothetical protein
MEMRTGKGGRPYHNFIGGVNARVHDLPLQLRSPSGGDGLSWNGGKCGEVHTLVAGAWTQHCRRMPCRADPVSTQRTDGRKGRGGGNFALTSEVHNASAPTHGLLPVGGRKDGDVTVGKLGTGGAYVAAQHAHRMPLRAQLRHQTATDQTSSACVPDKNAQDPAHVQHNI